MRGRRPRCEGTDRGVRCEALVRAEKVSAEGGSAVRECTEVAYRHGAAVGAVSLLPAKHYGAFRQNLALVVHKSDLERARMIAWFDCPIPPVGKLRDLVIGASDEWMSLKVETLSELFAAAKEAIASSAELPAPFADRLQIGRAHV